MKIPRSGMVIGLTIMAAVSLTGCSGSSEPDKIVEPAEIATMGFVREAETLAPLAGVAVYRDSLFMGLSDSTGYYTAPVGYPPVPRWEVSFKKEGFVEEVFELPADGVQDSLVPYFWRLDVLLTRISRLNAAADQVTKSESQR